MPDSKRLTSSSQPTKTEPVDPRLAHVRQYMQSVEAKIAEEEAAKPRGRRRNVAGREPAGFRFAIAPATFLHVLLAAIALTMDLLALTLTYHMLHVNFVVGRVVALPTGVLTAAVLGYLSVCYLGVIESTSTGETNVDSLQGDWQEWFWTLPLSLGMFALAAALGWGLSLVLPANVWLLIALTVLLAYPIFQLSSLETGSPAAPISLPVLASLVRRPTAWLVLYAISMASVSTVWAVARLAWRDPPYATMFLLGPVVTVGLFFYAWLLGQLAHLISTGEET